MTDTERGVWASAEFLDAMAAEMIKKHGLNSVQRAITNAAVELRRYHREIAAKAGGAVK